MINASRFVGFTVETVDHSKIAHFTPEELLGFRNQANSIIQRYFHPLSVGLDEVELTVYFTNCGKIVEGKSSLVRMLEGIVSKLELEPVKRAQLKREISLYEGNYPLSVHLHFYQAFV